MIVDLVGGTISQGDLEGHGDVLVRIGVVAELGIGPVEVLAPGGDIGADGVLGDIQQAIVSTETTACPPTAG